jgi:hypothetical protein
MGNIKRMSSTKFAVADGEEKPLPKFKEDPLPPSCPPADAKTLSQQIVLRLVENDPCTDVDFLSRHAEGAPIPAGEYDECRWRACSVHLDGKKGKSRLLSIAKLPHFKHKKYIAHLTIDGNAGVAKPWKNEPSHISFWVYSSFSAANAVAKLEPIT